MLRAFIGITLLCGLVASLEQQQALAGEASSICQPCGAGKGKQACLPLSSPLLTQLLGEGSLAAEGTVAQLAETACYLDHCVPAAALDRVTFCERYVEKSSKRLTTSRRLLHNIQEASVPTQGPGLSQGMPSGSTGEAAAWAPAQQTQQAVGAGAGGGKAPAPSVPAGRAGGWWGASGATPAGQATGQDCPPPSIQYAGADGKLACCLHPNTVSVDSHGTSTCGQARGSAGTAQAPSSGAAQVPAAATTGAASTGQGPSPAVPMTATASATPVSTQAATPASAPSPGGAAGGVSQTTTVGQTTGPGGLVGGFYGAGGGGFGYQNNNNLITRSTNDVGQFPGSTVAPQDQFVAQQQADTANSLRTRWQETMTQMGAQTTDSSATAYAPSGSTGSSAGSGSGIGGQFKSLLQEDEGFQDTSKAQPNMLQYSGGYVDLVGSVGRIIPHTPTARICADLCNADITCVAWKRKAGGAADTMTCTLLTSLKASPGDMLQPASGLPSKYTAPAKLQQQLPVIRYVNPLASSEVVEAGTKSPDALPSALYGCPYPPIRGAEGDCTPPPNCNCVGGVCYGSC